MSDEIKFKTFINEYRMVTGVTNKINWDSNNLPDPSALGMPTVILPRKALVQFRNDHALLLNFAAFICDKDPDKLTLDDLSQACFDAYDRRKHLG